MARTHTIDWELAKALRAQGLSYAQIADKAGGTMVAIRSKACRERWNDLASRTRGVLQQHGIETAAKTIKEQAPKLAEAWLAEAQADTVDSIASLRKLPTPKNLDDAKKREEMMLTHVKRGRAAFGLDDQKGSGVSINIMSQLCQIAAVQQGATVVAECSTDRSDSVSDASQVLDIETD